MKQPCGCCQGIEVLTPMATFNRPGLPALSYRVGTHRTFFETMRARLSSGDFPPLDRLTTRLRSDAGIAWLDAWCTVADVLTFYQERIANEGFLRTATERRSILELAKLIGYSPRPGVAASVFLAYTLDEDQSVIPPKPLSVLIPKGSRVQSVASAPNLPQTFETSDPLEARSTWNILRPRLNRPQTKGSILHLDEMPRGTSQQPSSRVYLQGVATKLKQNDPLLIDFGEKVDGKQRLELFHVISVEPDAAVGRTLVRIERWESKAELKSLQDDFTKAIEQSQGKVSKFPENDSSEVVTHAGACLAAAHQRLTLVTSTQELVDCIVNVNQELAANCWKSEEPGWHKLLADIIDELEVSLLRASTPHAAKVNAAAVDSPKFAIESLFKPLLRKPSRPPASAANLTDCQRRKSLEKDGDSFLQLLTSSQPALSDTLTTALANAKATRDNPIRVYALRVKASLFGNNVPKEPRYNGNNKPYPPSQWLEWVPEHERSDALFLDADYDQIQSGGFVAILKPDELVPAIRTGLGVRSLSRNAYGIGAKTTLIYLDKPWWKPITEAPGNFNVIRGTTVYAQSEELELAEEPIESPVCDGQSTPIELDGLYSGLQAGRWLIVSGERADVVVATPADEEAGGTSAKTVVPGIEATELVMLTAVTHDVARREQNGPLDDHDEAPLEGDKTHTFISLATKLSYCYKRDTVVIYGNVVGATHGETRNEVLGNGDGATALQQFAIRQRPLTFVSASTPQGIESTLRVRVNDIEWHETDSLAGLLPNDRKFITTCDDEGVTTVVFGNGRQGALLPTGQENVTAQYRNGIGKPGNVKARQITSLITRPIGVKSVVNPIRASGGADRETRDQARTNAPLQILALDRLVSTRDYADFSRTFAGIGRASAARCSNGRRQLVHVTIAGVDDAPIDTTSDLYRNLRRALRDFGDPYQPIQVDLREELALVIQASIRVRGDYLWEKVEAEARFALLDAFGFQRRDFGQDALLSDAISVVQSVEGVACVDVERFGAISIIDPKNGLPLGPNTIQEQVAGLLEKGPAQRVAALLARCVDGRILPAQIVLLNRDVPATLILNEVL